VTETAGYSCMPKAPFDWQFQRDDFWGRALTCVVESPARFPSFL
jgi:hypothetical protein